MDEVEPHPRGIPVNDAREREMDNDTCLLCGSRGASRRLGRLGRYAQTCDRCEQRRGSHLGQAPADGQLTPLGAGASGPPTAELLQLRP